MNQRSQNKIHIRLIIAALITLTGMFGLSAPAFAMTGAADSDETSISLIGHRGFSGAFPENTMPAFEGAIAAGFDGIEADVWKSDNGDLMIGHDATTDRMCGISDYIWHVNKMNRQDYPIAAPGSSAPGSTSDGSSAVILIPTLQEVLKLTKETGCTLFLHAKTAEGYELSDRGVRKIVRLIKKNNLQNQVIVFSERLKMARLFRGKGVRIGRLLCEADREKANEMIRWLKKYRGDTLLILNTEVLSGEKLGKSLVRYCHKRGIEIGTYWTYDAEDLKYLKSIGADLALSDYNLREP